MRRLRHHPITFLNVRENPKKIKFVLDRAFTRFFPNRENDAHSATAMSLPLRPPHSAMTLKPLCVDELENQLSKYGSLKRLYFYHHQLTTVFRNTMFGPEGRPQHCCAWLSVASSFPECASSVVPEEVTKIGRDAVLYVESLVESIMGGLEDLINILDSEGGFGSLETQLLPEQAANLMNLTSRISVLQQNPQKWHSVFSYQAMRAILKMINLSNVSHSKLIVQLEAAMQRLTNLCSIMNDMEPICVLHHVFVLREYMRDYNLGNFKRRLLTVLKIDNDFQRPSVLVSLIRRHTAIVHLAEQHVSKDLTHGIWEILLTETFCGPLSSLHLFEKPAEQHTGSATEAFCFKSTRPVGGYFAQSVTALRELKAFVHIFGTYGVDRLDKMIREHTAALLNCIDTSLRANHENLEAVARSVHSSDKTEIEANIKQIVIMDTIVGFCIQAG
ncbi:NAP1 [Olea europaea subsp. europaea]|uniref:NAP1 n=1 Tax=Olea europaea subsp. europaea TaxID=158383 RepID=A0A8S0TXV9_OLEEU|nr:NAP1 [Olea europaea subsp. europaea]